MDTIEFFHEVVTKPIPRECHKYFNHIHLGFDPEEGQQDFRDEVNRILARNGLVYELRPDGQMRRLAPTPLREALTSSTLATGDIVLDQLLETARRKYLDPDSSVRREGLEKLWDAWERIKTLEPGKDKKASATGLIDRPGLRSHSVKSLNEGHARSRASETSSRYVTPKWGRHRSNVRTMWTTSSIGRSPWCASS